jgi:hypothetical protein
MRNEKKPLRATGACGRLMPTQNVLGGERSRLTAEPDYRICTTGAGADKFTTEIRAATCRAIA